MPVCQPVTAFADGEPKASPSVAPMTAKSWRAPFMFLTPLRESVVCRKTIGNRIPALAGAPNAQHFLLLHPIRHRPSAEPDIRVVGDHPSTMPRHAWVS